MTNPDPYPIPIAHPARTRRGLRWLSLALGGAGLAVAQAPTPAVAPAPAPAPAAQAPGGAAPSLAETKLALTRWLETEQTVARERKQWQQDKEVLAGRLELARKEVATLTERVRTATADAAKAAQQRDELLAEEQKLAATAQRLATAATALEAGVRRLWPMLPEPVRARTQPFFDRMPADAAATKVTPAERLQNVLAILNDANKSNRELTTAYEVHPLPDGRSAEVKVVYLGLAQAWYVGADGSAGIGRPAADGWHWEPAPALANDILTALEILQGKHTPAFVPLPVKLQ